MIPMKREVIIILEPLISSDTNLPGNPKTDDEYGCARCKKSCPTKNHLREHLRLNHRIYEDNNVKTYNYDCSQCGKDFPIFSDFNKHWLCHQPPKLICTECPAKFRRPQELRIHLLQRHNLIEKRKLFECDNCGKTFKSSYHLNYHLAYHRPPQFSCTDCGDKFFIWRNLQLHIRRGHKKSAIKKEQTKKLANKGKSVDLTCPVCHNQFACATSLSAHAKMHKPKQFKCGTCEAQFFRQCDLENHQTSIHFAEVDKGTECDICGKEFRSRQGLAVHKRFHSSPTVSCSKCELKFYTKGYLTIHTQSSHTAIWLMPDQCSNKQPTCAVCCRPFRVKSKLKNHLHIHYRYDQNLHCHFCQRIFNHSGSLITHLRVTHNE